MKFTLNLASRAYVNRRRLYGVYAATAVVLALILILNLVNLIRSRERRTELERRIAAEQGDAGGATHSAAEIAALGARIDFANTLLMRDGFRWTALFDRLEAQMVPGIGGIEKLDPDYETGELELSASADSLATLRRFIDRLSTSPEIAGVYLLQHELVEDEGGAQVAFTLDLRLKEVTE